MSRKSKLSGMAIRWESVSLEQRMQNEAKAILDALEPHTKLEYLKIGGYGGEMLSSWFGTLKNVTELGLHNCNQVEYLEDEIKGDLYFPSLKILTLDCLRNLKGWWRQQVDEEAERPRLPKVSFLRIALCQRLKGRQMPLFEQVEILTLEMVDIELVTELLIGNIDPNCSPPFHKNNKLKQLTLDHIRDLKSVPQGWLRHLTQLQKLHIQSCRELKWVSCRGLAHLTALKDLSLSQDTKIADTGDEDGRMGMTEAGMPWKALKGLESLSISTLGVHLIEVLEFLTSLKSIEFTKWKDEEEVGVEEIWEAGQLELSFKALHNLQTLKIRFDDNTASLPKFIQYLPSLQCLFIRDCEELHLGWKILLSRKLQGLEFRSVKRVISVEDMVVVQQSQLLYLRISLAEAEWVDNVPWNSLSSLHFLDLSIIRGMKQLPDGIQHLTSLQKLNIWVCGEMRSLPTWIPKLTSLQDLDIWECSVELKRRCGEQGGEDWPLIRHIPYTKIRASYEGNDELATNGSKEDEEQGEGSRKKGWCGLPLPKFDL